MPLALSRTVAAALILALTLVNYRGVRLGATVQNIFTILKVLGLVMLIGSMFATGGRGIPQPPLQPSASFLAHLAAAMIACVWAYNGVGRLPVAILCVVT